jgi:short-subunit dehydrogenase
LGRFDGRVVVITGATSGIGREAVTRFADEGARVVGTGRDPGRLDELRRTGILTVPLDVTDDRSVAAATTEILAREGRVDVLVNNAGIGLFEPWNRTEIADLERILDTNLYGVARVTRALLPQMLERRDGIVVNVASVAGRRAYKKHTAYCASKHALIGWSEALRCDLEGTGVSVVVACPPAVRTPFFENAGYMTFDEDHPGFTPMTAADAARHLVEAAAKRQRTRIFGARARLLDAIHTVAPGAVDALRKLKR